MYTHKEDALQFLHKGEEAYHIGDYETSIKHVYYARHIFSTLQENILFVDSSFLLAKAYLDGKKMKEAIDMFKSTLIQYTKLKNTIKAAECALHIGNIFVKQKVYQESRRYLDIALVLFSKLNAIEKKADTLKMLLEVNICNNNIDLKKMIMEFRKIIKMYKNVHRMDKAGFTEFKLAGVFLNQQMKKDSEKMFLQALESFKIANIKDMYINVATQLSRFYIQENNKKKAQIYYNIATI